MRVKLDGYTKLFATRVCVFEDQLPIAKMGPGGRRAGPWTETLSR